MRLVVYTSAKSLHQSTCTTTIQTQTVRNATFCRAIQHIYNHFCVVLLSKTVSTDVTVSLKFFEDIGKNSKFVDLEKGVAE